MPRGFQENAVDLMSRPTVMISGDYGEIEAQEREVEEAAREAETARREAQWEATEDRVLQTELEYAKGVNAEHPSWFLDQFDAGRIKIRFSQRNHYLKRGLAGCGSILDTFVRRADNGWRGG